MSTIESIHWLDTAADGFDLLMDHKDLTFIIDPVAICPGLT